MWKFVATAKQILWEFVELGFLAVLAIILLQILLGENAGPYVNAVVDNVAAFAGTAASGVLGVVITLGIIFLVLRRTKPSGTR